MEHLPWVGYSRGVLVFTGFCYALLFVALVAMAFVAPQALFEGIDAKDLPGAQAIWVAILGAVGVPFTMLNFLAAWGLGRRSKWAWILTLILGGIYAPSICLPFGAVLLYGMLRTDTRKAFGF